MAGAGEHRPPASPAIAGQGFDGGRFNRLAISRARRVSGRSRAIPVIRANRRLTAPSGKFGPGAGVGFSDSIPSFPFRRVLMSDDSKRRRGVVAHSEWKQSDCPDHQARRIGNQDDCKSSLTIDRLVSKRSFV